MIVRAMALDRRPSPPPFDPDKRPGLAFDRATCRSIDQDGRLHISVTNISKATVDLYYGHEIPDFERLGLAADRAYYLLRDPEEMAKAASTFNNLPILCKHIPVSAEAPQQEYVVGSTGTHAAFESPYLQNSAVVWVKDSIDLIENDEQREWSCGYYYTPDMTPGHFNGLRFDGVMRNIVGNHVALVKDGRAGPDVVVGDEKPEPMSMAKIKSRRALMLSGALVSHIAPKLAMDAKVDISAALKGVTAKTLPKTRDAVAGRIVALVKGKLAQDEAVDVEDVVTIIKAIEGTDTPDSDDIILDEEDMTPPAVDADDDAVAKIMAFLKGKLSDEDMETVAGMASAETADDAEPAAPPGGERPKDKKPAMDAASVGRIVANIREAERAVAPFIGTITTPQDTPEAIYKMALDAKGVDTKGVAPSAFKAMVGMLAKPDAKAPPAGLALDAKGATDFATRFPNASTILAN